MPLIRLFCLIAMVLVLAGPARASSLDKAAAELAEAEKALADGNKATASFKAKLATESLKKFASEYGDAHFDVVFPVLEGAGTKELAESISDLKLEIQLRDQIAKAAAHGDEALAETLRRAMRDKQARWEILDRIWDYFDRAPLAKAMACVGVVLKAQDYVGLYKGYKQNGGLGLARAMLDNASFTAKLTGMGLEYVKDNIVAGLVNPDCEDLIKGVSNVPGYQFQGKGLDVQAMAEMLPAFDPTVEPSGSAVPKEVDKAYKEKIVPIVLAYLNNRFRKSGMDTPLDQEVRREVMRSCGPEIKKTVLAVRREGGQVRKDALAQAQEILDGIAVTGVEPESLVTGEDAYLSMSFSVPPEPAQAEAEDVLAQAEASNPNLFVRYEFHLAGPDGSPVELSGSNLFNERVAVPMFAGNHTLRVVLAMSGLNPAFGSWGLVERRIERTFVLPAKPPAGGMDLEVVVLPEADPEAQGGKSAPIPARLSLDGGPEVFAASGRHTFQGVAAGTRHVEATAEGYGPARADYQADPGASPSDTLVLRLTPAPTLKVELRRQEDNELVQGQSWINLSGANGAHISLPGPMRVFADLSPGTYTLTATAVGRSEAREKVSIGGAPGQLSLARVLAMDPKPQEKQPATEKPTAGEPKKEPPAGEESGQGYSISDDPFHQPGQQTGSQPDMDQVAALTAQIQEDQEAGGWDQGAGDYSQSQSDDYLSPWVSLSEEKELDNIGGQAELEVVEMHAGLDTGYKAPRQAASGGFAPEEGYYPGGTSNPWKEESPSQTGEVRPGSARNPYKEESLTRSGEVRASQPGNIQATNPYAATATRPGNVQATQPGNIQATNPYAVTATRPGNVQATNPYKVTATRSSGRFTTTKGPKLTKTPRNTKTQTRTAKTTGKAASKTTTAKKAETASRPATSGSLGMIEVYHKSGNSYRLLETIPLRYAKMTSSQDIAYTVRNRPAKLKFVIKAEAGKKMWASSVTNMGHPHTPSGQPSRRVEFTGAWAQAQKQTQGGKYSPGAGMEALKKQLENNIHPTSITVDFNWNAPAVIGDEVMAKAPHWKKYKITFK